MSEQPMQPLLESWFAQREVAPADVSRSTARVMARLPQTRQRSRWWPMPSLRRTSRPASSGQEPARGFSMFSALKIVTASIIVALFGGLLMAGVLTAPQGEEVLPAAPTASASPEAEPTTVVEPTPTPESTAPPVDVPDSVTKFGAVAEEIEPGVLALRPKGGGDAHKLTESLPDIVGLDGSWWRFSEVRDTPDPNEDYTVLTKAGELEPIRWKRYWNPIDGSGDLFSDLAVAPDGTVWLALDKGVVSYDGTTWTVHLKTSKDERWVRHYDGEGPMFEGSVYAALEIAPDGSVWVARFDAGANEVEVLRFDGGEWQSMGTFPEVPTPANPDANLPSIHLSAHGDDVWLVTSYPVAPRRYHDGVWEEVPPPADLEPIVIEEGSMSNILGIQAGPDGTLWLHTIRPGGLGQLGLDYYDGAEWGGWHTEFLEPDEEVALREADPDWRPPWTPDLFGGVDALAPDGAIWLKGNDPWRTCDGLYRYVGMERTHHFLTDRCVDEIRIMPDGDVWLTAMDKKRTKLYLIPAESVATPNVSST